jgi:peptide/nickel transport system permease protein
MTRKRYILGRLAQAVLVLIGVMILTFLLIHIVPGNPARTILGVHATPKAVRALDAQFGLNKSLPVQLWDYFDRIIHGNLGTSYYYNSSVGPLIVNALPVTIWLIVLGMVIAVVVAVPLALWAATKQGRTPDHIVRVVPMVGLGMPPFWIGFVLLILLSLDLKIFPSGGYGTTVSQHFQGLILPAITVAAGTMPLLVRSLRTSLIEILESDYIRAAIAKGLSRRRVLFRHALRNALLPAVSVLAVNIGFWVGGTVVIEQVFNLPGLGNLMLTGVLNRDFQVVQSVALVYGVMIVLINFSADLLYSYIDPRVVFGE